MSSRAPTMKPENARWRRACVLAVAIAVAACGDDPVAAPTIELYIDGSRAPEAPIITFPNVVAGGAPVAAQIELKNLGPGALTLSGSPPVRVEKDDRLAFTTVLATPSKTRYAAGESLVVSVLFQPHAPGRSEGTVVVPVAERESPFTIDVVGEGVADGSDAPILAVTIDGAPVADAFDFGAVPVGERRVAKLRLTNAGTGKLILPADAISVSPTKLFTTDAAIDLELEADEHTEVDLAFAADACSAYESNLTITATVPATSVVVKLKGRGGTNPQGFDDVTEPFAFGPDGDLALTSAPGGVRRLAVGNLTVGNFTGQVQVLTWDGCTLSQRKTMSPLTVGVDANYFGSQVALDDTGQLLLVTARDYQASWLYDLQADNSAKLAAVLGTFEKTRGMGKGAALAADASAAFIGLSLADSGFQPHGAVLAYERPKTGWTNLPEARWKLWPSNPTGVTALGSWVESSADGRVVLAGGFTTGAEPQPIIYVWEATGPPDDPTWGKSPTVAEPDARAESMRLVVPVGETAGHAAAVISRDGQTIAMATKAGDGGATVHIWLRGASWADAVETISTRGPTTSVAVAGASSPRLALTASGAALLVADAAAVRELARPSNGWDPSAAVARSWVIAAYGPIALTPDDVAFGALDSAGRAWLTWR